MVWLEVGQTLIMAWKNKENCTPNFNHEYMFAYIYIYTHIYIYERELDHLDEHLGRHPYIVVISPGTNLFGDTPDPHNKKSKVNYQ